MSPFLAIKHPVTFGPRPHLRYDEPGAAPSGFMIGGVPTGVIDERDPEKR
jgi:hypothetical protein